MRIQKMTTEIRVNEWEEGWIIGREKLASTRLRKAGKW